MAYKRIDKRRKRMSEIEDRKIAILLEFGNINKRILELRMEYSRLDEEYYDIWTESIRSECSKEHLISDR